MTLKTCPLVVALALLLPGCGPLGIAGVYLGTLSTDSSTRSTSRFGPITTNRNYDEDRESEQAVIRIEEVAPGRIHVIFGSDEDGSAYLVPMNGAGPSFTQSEDVTYEYQSTSTQTDNGNTLTSSTTSTITFRDTELTRSGAGIELKGTYETESNSRSGDAVSSEDDSEVEFTFEGEQIAAE